MIMFIGPSVKIKESPLKVGTSGFQDKCKEGLCCIYEKPASPGDRD